MHPAGKCHRRTVGGLEVFLEEHTELKDRERLRLSRDHDGARVAKGIRRFRRDFDVLGEGIEAGERAVGDGLGHHSADLAHVGPGKRKPLYFRRLNRRQLPVFQETVFQCIRQLRQNGICPTLGGIGDPRCPVVEVRSPRR